MKTFDQFKQFYHQRGFLDMGTCTRKPSRPLNDRQLLTAYNSYLRKMDNQKEKEHKKDCDPSRDSLVRKSIETRDGGKCRLIRLLTKSELDVFYGCCSNLYKTLDAAHVWGKGSYPHMRYVEDNVVLLNRFSHNMLDTQHSPISGKIISAEEKEYWWKRILGDQTYTILEELSRRR